MIRFHNLNVAALAMFTVMIPATNVAAESGSHWTPLFNGTNIDGWSIQFDGIERNADPSRLVQVEDGVLHFYKDARAGSKQPFGYVVTERKYSNYRLRLEFKWGEKKFAPRAISLRDSGLLYHVTATDKVWPDCVEYQIQEGDVGDIYTVSTRVTAPTDPDTTNIVVTISTNKTTGVIRTNSFAEPIFLEPAKGGMPTVCGRVGASLRVIRNPQNEHPDWNVAEIEVRGDSATHRINGQINNRCYEIKQFANGEWMPLNEGRIALQLEGAEIIYRKIEIQELQN